MTFRHHLWYYFLFWTRLFCTTTCFLQRKCIIKVKIMIWAQPSKLYLLKWIHNKIISSSYYEIYHLIIINHHVFFMLFRCSNLVIFSDLQKRKPIPVIILPLKTFALISCDGGGDSEKGKRLHKAGFMKNVLQWKYSIPQWGKQWPYLKTGGIKAVCTMK